MSTTGSRQPDGPVDWAEIRRRIEAARAVPPEQTRSALEERARRLARPAVAVAHGDMLELITFALGNERYAIESRFVLDVFRLIDLAILPGAESPVRGITAWRGSLLTILDLRAPLGLSVGALNDLSRVIVLGQGRAAFGILADAVHDLATLPAATVVAPPDGVAPAREYLRGITPAAVLVLDGAKLLQLYG